MDSVFAPVDLAWAKSLRREEAALRGLQHREIVLREGQDVLEFARDRVPPCTSVAAAWCTPVAAIDVGHREILRYDQDDGACGYDRDRKIIGHSLAVCR